jgi:hypothetical protein
MDIAPDRLLPLGAEVFVGVCTGVGAGGVGVEVFPVPEVLGLPNDMPPLDVAVIVGTVPPFLPLLPVELIVVAVVVGVVVPELLFETVGIRVEVEIDGSGVSIVSAEPEVFPIEFCDPRVFTL